MVKNGWKRTKNSSFREMAGKGGIIDWSSSLSIHIFATAPGENIFVNKSGGRIKWSHMTRQKWWKMAKNGQWRDNGLVMAWSSFFSIDTTLLKNICTPSNPYKSALRSENLKNLMRSWNCFKRSFVWAQSRCCSSNRLEMTSIWKWYTIFENGEKEAHWFFGHL